MNHKLYLCLAAIAMVIAASSIGVSGGKMSRIMNRFHSSSGSSSSAASSASASSYSSSGSSVAGGRRGFTPRHVHHGQHGKYQQSAQQLHYPPAPVPAYNFAASEAEAQVNARSARNGGTSSAASSAATSGYGSSASGASSASGSGSAAAAAAAAAAAGGSASGSASSQGGHAARPVFHKARHQPREPLYAPEVVAYPAPPAHQPQYKGPPSFPTMPHVAAAPRYPPRNRFNGGGVSSSAAAAAAAGGAASAAAAANNGGYYGAGGHSHGHQHGHQYGNAYNGGVSSARAAAGASPMSEPVGYNGYNVEQETFDEHYSEPETVDEYAAGTGTYSNDGKGLVTSSYVRSTEDKEIHEDGKEADDRYYNAGSYGKTYDDNNHESYSNDDEDIIHTPTMFRSKKSSTNYMKDKTKTRRESGSSVLAKDKHSASYNKNIKKFKENVDQHTHKEGEGVLENSHSSESSNFDEEDEEAFDSRNLGTFTGLDGVYHARRPIFNPTAAAAASASSAGVSSSSSAGSR